MIKCGDDVIVFDSGECDFSRPGSPSAPLCAPLLSYDPPSCTLYIEATSILFTRRGAGFTALAHRSTVEVAFTHGVFCLDHASSPPTCRSGASIPCPAFGEKRHAAGG